MKQCNNTLSPVQSKSGLVEWVEQKKLEGLRIFASSSPDSDYIQDDSYLVGHVIGGKYKGGDILLTIVSYQGMGYAEDFDRIIKLNNNYYLLKNYSDQIDDANGNKKPLVNLVTDSDFTLQDLDFPQTLHLNSPTSDFVFATSAGFFRNGRQKFCGDHLVKIFTDPNVGDVYGDTKASGDPGKPNYYNPMYGFYVKSPDGTVRTYQLSVSFISTDKVPLVIFNGNKTNKNEYSYQGIGGCGATKFLDVADVQSQDLIQVGTTFDGQIIYSYKNTDTKVLKDMYDWIYTPDGQNKPTYQQFLLDTPIFFWQNPFGQFVQFEIIKYQPVAECGKPVIYLYPETTEKISVKLAPVGGFSYTEPAYNNGWNVIADPNSNITNLADGKSYPYLFWEGRGGLYQTPNKGFVTAQSGVHQLLEDKLSAFGLNQKERKDFEEFWEPKMQTSPYYFVTFMGNNIMDGIAPLSITPKPDTIIRVLMDFTPLDKPISVQGFNIRTPERKGFTVVEWGGVLR